MSNSPVLLANGDSVVGTTSDGGDVRIFRGIAYAEPPVGQYRFRPTIAKRGTATTWPADAFGPMAPQTPGAMESMFGAGPPVVDEATCLTLNVWAPTQPAPADATAIARPVMVWIHGGSYLAGAGTVPWYDGTQFVRNGDVIIVTINYRLGALGYLYHPDIPGSGNAALSDQLLALRWVQDNIAAFGGDAARVTVFGESAGAMSIGALIGTPSAEGLFSQAVLQSGACAHVSNVAASHAVATSFMSAARIADVTNLYELTIEQILDAQNVVLASGNHGALPFQPTFGIDLLPEHPLTAIAKHRGARPQAILHGTNTDEYRLFSAFDPKMDTLDDDGVTRRLVRRHGEAAPALVGRYRAQYRELPAGALYSTIETDLSFRRPADELAGALRQANVASWQYEFAWPTPVFGGRLGACHALEIPFVFAALDQRGVSMFVGEDASLGSLAKTMQSAWISFAHGRPPRHDWPAEDDRRPTYRFHVDSSAGLTYDPFETSRMLWS